MLQIETLPASPPTLRGETDVDAPQILLANGVGILALLAWLFRSLSTGTIVTRREHENRVADKDKVIADKDAQIVMWQATAQTKDAQIAELLEHSRLGAQAWASIEARAKARDGEA